MTKPNALLVIIRHAPHSSSVVREGLDAALVAAAFGQSVHILFMGQGITSLLKEQSTGAPGQKAILPTIDMLEMYDIDQLLVPEQMLSSMHLTADDLVEGITWIASDHLPILLKQYTHILNF